MEQQIHDDPPTHPADLPLEVERLSISGTVAYVIHGIGVALGMGLLWSLETVRNSYFRMLDRRNVKAPVRPASAFPPGRPRRRPIADAPRL
jgi:hypothetical protein